jgi:hypothetical protein
LARLRKSAILHTKEVEVGLMSILSKPLTRAALKVLEFRCGLSTAVPTVEEIDLVRSHADGEWEAGLPLDELARSVIRRELEREASIIQAQNAKKAS